MTSVDRYTAIWSDVKPEYDRVWMGPIQSLDSEFAIVETSLFVPEFVDFGQYFPQYGQFHFKEWHFRMQVMSKILQAPDGRDAVARQARAKLAQSIAELPSLRMRIRPDYDWGLYPL